MDLRNFFSPNYFYIQLYIRTQLFNNCSVTKYSVRVEFGPAGPNISNIFGPVGLFLYPTKYIRRFWSGLSLSPAGPNVSGIFGSASLKYSTISSSGY